MPDAKMKEGKKKKTHDTHNVHKKKVPSSISEKKMQEKQKVKRVSDKTENERIAACLTENSKKVLKKRYLLKNVEGEVDEEGEVKVIENYAGLFRRVAHCVAGVDAEYGGDSRRTEREFYNAISKLEFLPNSPTLMNAGKGEGLQQLSACFVIPIEDDMESILEGDKRIGMIHKSGGGTGMAFSRLRPKGDIVSTTGGASSGPVSFMKKINATTEAIKQGGTRRGANMGILSVDHPDSEEFIECKSHEGALSNFNISVAVTDKFMRALETGEEFELINPRTGKVVKKIDANALFDKIVEQVWRNGEPGVIFIDKVNEDNPTPKLGAIESTNPCVDGNTFVSTDKGLIKIKDLAGKEISVLTDNRTIAIEVGQQQQLQQLQQLQLQLAKGTTLRKGKCWMTGYKRLLKITTKAGYELRATPDHLIPTPKGWKRMDELKPGFDEVFIQSGTGVFNSDESLPFDVSKLGRNRERYNPDLPTKWSKELGQVLGWLIGDGWLVDKNKNRRVGFTFGKNDKEAFKYLAAILSRFYGKRLTSIIRENEVIHLSYHSKSFVNFFKKLGVKDWYAYNKRIPVSVFGAPRYAVVGFLQGLFSADGTINIQEGKSAYIRLSSKSLDLLKEVQILLLNFGIFSKIYDRRRPQRKMFRYVTKKGLRKEYYSAEEEYELEISKDSVPIFLEEIGFIGKKHSSKIKALQQKRYYKVKFIDSVKSLEDSGEDIVFDISEPFTHSFIANGIVVHNCGEQPLLPYESCNLGSINLSKMVKEGKERKEIDWEKLKKTVRMAVHFLDNVIDANEYPYKEIEELTKANRKIGLGVMGFADLLYMLEIPYNSDEAVELAEKLMKFIDDEAKIKSVEIARERGTFPNFKGSIYDTENPEDAVRNAARTTIAPTGSISLVAGSSSGIEPPFALAYESDRADTIFKEVNPIFEGIARKEGWYSDELMRKIAAKGNVQGMKEVPEKWQRVFVTALDISPEAHVKMQAAFQKYTNNAVSKTVNLPKNATREDVKKIILLAYALGCKGVTIYRDGSRVKQVLKIKAEDIQITKRSTPAILHKGVRMRVDTGCGEFFSQIFPDEKGAVEMFTTAGKAGGCASAQSEAIGRLISLALKYNIPHWEIIKDLNGIRCPNLGPIGEDRIMSCPDGVSKALIQYFKEEERKIMNKSDYEKMIRERNKIEKKMFSIKRKRPHIIFGPTIKRKTGCGNIYVTINEDDQGINEILACLGKAGGCASAQNEAVTRLVSLLLKHHVPPGEMIKELKGISCHAAVTESGEEADSCASAIVKALEEYLEIMKNIEGPFISDEVRYRTNIKNEEAENAKNGKTKNGKENGKRLAAGACPECGGRMEAESGCFVCRECGFSKCEGG